ncbi:ABC transporter substrate-binding protein [Devosia lacusdianchii]|uniref:ABC transporter substrate-binding protein n=1 Tax=Devosia lacusdianchii TaxID=2917991 RepID=UPI001F0633E3|nr:iron-siderophore ABC transporter substrate-binding protein [Devosia sp. JXJ CY 41]
MLKSLFTSALLGSALVLGMTGLTTAREITHAMGVTEVPDAPQRIVMLTNEGTEALLYIGVVPVGAVQSWDADPWYAHVADALKDTVPLGFENAVNLEVLASLEPDLIIGNKVRQEKIYDQLSAIAPTVFAEDLSGSWKDNLALYSRTVGKEAEGQKALADFDARAAALAAAVGPALEEQLSLVRFSPGRTRIYYKDTFAGGILAQIGFKRPPAQDRDEFAEEVQKERIPDMAGDRIFYFSADADPDEAKANLADWTSDPLWLNLEAVKAGKAQRVSELVWNTGGGIYCANMLLDELAVIYGVPTPTAN